MFKVNDKVLFNNRDKAVIIETSWLSMPNIYIIRFLESNTTTFAFEKELKKLYPQNYPKLF